MESAGCVVCKEGMPFHPKSYTVKFKGTVPGKSGVPVYLKGQCNEKNIFFYMGGLIRSQPRTATGTGFKQI